MKLQKSILGLLLLAQFCMASPAGAKWVHAFVVWDDNVYVITDDRVDKAGKEIGEVTKYSSNEGTYPGNFSNEYKKGTKYHAIKGVSTKKAIAIQEKNGAYSKAVWDGKYKREFVPAIIDNASNPRIISIVMGIGAIAFLYSLRSIEKGVKRG